MNQKIISVGEVSQYIRRLFSEDFLLKRIAVSGEVSNLTYHRSGHIYFTLKDETASLSCVMWAGDRNGLGFRMQNGDLVVATGSVDVYLQQGRYQLYARRIERQGAGLLYERFLALKAELEEMGMFAEEYKQPIPFYVKRLGIVTAPTGAAVQDIRNIALRRNPYIELILYPALVQGEGAAASIARGIRKLDAMGLDCLIVGRGGGSIEDLWAFNEEEVARAIFDCRTPVISAVGHETDTTIADLTADLRAPTPSAAAELAVCDIREILEKQAAFREELRLALLRRIADAREQAASFRKNLRHLSPENQVRDKRQRAADLEEKLYALVTRELHEKKTELRLLAGRFRERPVYILESSRQRLERLTEQLQSRNAALLREKRHRLQLLIQTWEGLSPVRKLQQGFSHVADDGGHTVASAAGITAGMRLHITVTDGVIHTEVTGTELRAGEKN